MESLRSDLRTRGRAGDEDREREIVSDGGRRRGRFERERGSMDEDSEEVEDKEGHETREGLRKASTRALGRPWQSTSQSRGRRDKQLLVGIFLRGIPAVRPGCFPIDTASFCYFRPMPLYQSCAPPTSCIACLALRAPGASCLCLQCTPPGDWPSRPPRPPTSDPNQPHRPTLATCDAESSLLGSSFLPPSNHRARNMRPMLPSSPISA